MLALTAATPILKGRLADTDVRWNVVAQSVDCRTSTERGETTTLKDGHKTRDSFMAGDGIKRIEKSRFDSISCYLFHCKENEGANAVLNSYHDIPVEVDEETYDKLINNGIDPALARHLAHLFIRDPLVVFENCLSVNDELSTEHFENIQSTNWQTARWKVPPLPQYYKKWKEKEMKSKKFTEETTTTITTTTVTTKRWNPSRGSSVDLENKARKSSEGSGQDVILSEYDNENDLDVSASSTSTSSLFRTRSFDDNGNDVLEESITQETKIKRVLSGPIRVTSPIENTNKVEENIAKDDVFITSSEHTTIENQPHKKKNGGFT